MSLKFFTTGWINYVIGSLLMYIMVLGGVTLTDQAIQASRERKMEALRADDFLSLDLIETTKKNFLIGKNPSFYFDITYFFSGTVTGDNVLRCDGFRSSFGGKGFVPRERIGKDFEDEKVPFVFNGNLPDFDTTCHLRSNVTLCDQDFKVCRTQIGQSNEFTISNH